MCNPLHMSTQDGDSRHSLEQVACTVSSDTDKCNRSDRPSPVSST